MIATCPQFEVISAFGVGYGTVLVRRVGTAIGRRLQGFGMPVACAARAPGQAAAGWGFVADPVALNGRSDHLFVALAATPETLHIVDTRVLAVLGPGGTLISIGRAACVDETALLDAPEGGRRAGVALEVFEGAPNRNPRFPPPRTCCCSRTADPARSTRAGRRGS